MIAIRLRHENGIVRESVVRNLPATIGRDADNDFVLFDNSVSKHHARIEKNATGELELVDLESRNGIRVGNSPVKSHLLRHATRCFIGIVEIEIEPLSSEVTRIINVQEWQHFNRRRSLRDHLKTMLLAALGWMAFALVQPSYWSPEREDRGLILIWQLLTVSVALPVCSFLLLAILRTVGRKLRIADTLSVFCKIICIFATLGILSNILYYPLSTTWFHHMNGLIFAGTCIWAVTMLAGVRRQPLTLGFKLGWGAVAAVIYLIFTFALSMSDKIHGDPQTDYTVLPPISGYSGYAVGLDKYLGNVEKIAKDAAAEAAESRANAVR